LKHLVEKAAELLNKARAVVAVTGAGVSAESGIPTFRGEDGLWNTYRAEDLATPEAFAKNPALVWQWYNWRRGLFRKSSPNPAHVALAKMENGPFDFTLVTQNIDGLHSLAGSKNVLEVHGSIWRIRCDTCGYVEHNETVPLPEPPFCTCGAPLRPDVVWFGEALEAGIIGKVMEALMRAEVVIVAGTSSVVYPAASFAVTAMQAGAACIEVNLHNTPLTPMADVAICGKAGDIMPQIVKAIL